MNNIPNLFIPAFGKCATSTTALLLGDHPEIEPPDISMLDWWNVYPKEPCFFVGDMETRLEYCKKAFEGKSRYRIDGTPYYHTSQESLSGIKKFSEHPKAIILMRDPIGRAISLWNHYLQAVEKIKPEGEYFWGFKLSNKTFGEQVDHEIKNGNKGPLCSLNYPLYMERMWKVFSAGDTHYAFMEELGENRQKFFNDIFDFLGIHRMKVDAQDHNVRAKIFEPKREDIEKLRGIVYRDDERIKEIVGRLPKQWGEKTRYE